jgi:methylenetetrahydrofolate reductase (NADPH)
MLDMSLPIIEVLPPRMDPPDDLEERLAKFKTAFDRVHNAGFAVSMPDSPMGHLRFGAMETLEYLELPVDPDRLLLHINTFHPKVEIYALLKGAADRGLRNLLVVSGDGSPKRHRLEPAEIGTDAVNVTSVELLGYIRRACGGAFDLGVAYNQYEPPVDEDAKLTLKLHAGARFVITQPWVTPSPAIETLRDRGLPLFLGLWFSANIALLAECIDHPLQAPDPYDPFAVWAAMRHDHPGCGYYLSCLPARQFPRLMEIQRGVVVAG